MTRGPVDSRDLGLLEANRLATRAERVLDEDAPRRSLGAPTSLQIKSVQATYGDLVPLDPTHGTADGAGVYLYARLPKGRRDMVGEKITFKNYSASGNLIRLQPVRGDTIDKSEYKDFTIPWGQVTVLLIAEDKWICCAQNGCSDCTGSCLAACADTCNSSCVGSCASAATGSCSGCSGSCASAATGSCVGCAGSCAGGCAGSCGGGCTGSCTVSCAEGCTGDCSGSCATECAGGCSAACESGCTTTCAGSCQGDCSGSCNSGCSQSCYGRCDGSCAGACTGGVEA